jgi:hypothetical protein
MKKIVSLILTFSTLVCLGQSKKEQIITLNNRVDSLKLALSEETQIKLRNEKRDALKIIDLNNSIKKRDITNTDLRQKIEDESKLNKTLRAEIENKNLKIDSLDDLIRQQYTKEYSGLIPNNFFGCWGKCGGTMDGDWITISKNKTGHIIIGSHECGGSVEEIFKVQGTEKFVFLYDEGCEGAFIGYSAALISATNRSISITEIPRVDFEFFLKKNSPSMMILDTEEGYQMNKDILNLFNSKGNKRWYNYSKYANGYGGQLK